MAPSRTIHIRQVFHGYTAECLSRTITFRSRRLVWHLKSPEMTASNFCLWGAL